ncbi:MAG: hypothetical protein CENE_02412 [Candidatus Celerinatantimonas neptuna]|nr:MAG: hypothetical protein CENE_02412 [Candidatus Celerinatantimonas neptuna]
MKKNYRDESNRLISSLSELWPQYQCIELVACTTLKIDPGVILTAYNPFGVNVSRRVNQRRSLLLQYQIRRLGIDFQVVWGSSIDGCHAEFSFVLGCSLSEGLRLAKQWRQLAVYAICSNQLFLYDTQKEQLPIMVGHLHRLWTVKPLYFKALCQRF